MKSIIRLFVFVINVLLISSITGCADFPDDYAVDASIEINRESIKLANDKKNYNEVIVVDFRINKNSFDDIAEAYVEIGEKVFDVRDQVDPHTGGKVEITNTSSTYGTRKVRAFLKVATHAVTKEINIDVKSDDFVELETSDASNVTVFSATLSALVNNSNLVSYDNICILAHDGPIDFKVGEQTPQNEYGYWNVPHVLKCRLDGNKYKADIEGLEPDKVYYYQVVRLGYNPTTGMYNVIYSASPKQFKSATSTAKVDAESRPGMFDATISATVDPGNTADVKINESYKTIDLFAGTDPEALSKIGTFSENSIVINSLTPGTKYYYEVRYRCCASGSYYSVIKSSGVKSFTTESTTASISSNADDINDFEATVSGSFSEGNMPSYMTQSGHSYDLYLYYGKSPEDLHYRQYQERNSTNESLVYKLSTLDPSTTYYYKIACHLTLQDATKRYYIQNVVESEVKSFSTGCSSVTETHTYPNWVSTNEKPGDKSSVTYSINAKAGSILAFDYTDNFNDYYDFTVQLSGAANMTLHPEQGRFFYKFTKTGNYSLNLTFWCRYWDHPARNIEVTNIKVYDVH